MLKVLIVIAILGIIAVAILGGLGWLRPVDVELPSVEVAPYQVVVTSRLARPFTAYCPEGGYEFVDGCALCVMCYELLEGEYVRAHGATTFCGEVVQKIVVTNRRSDVG